MGKEYRVGDKVRVRQECTGMVREGTVFNNSFDGDCIRYNDGITTGFDRMDNVEVIMVIRANGEPRPSTVARFCTVGANVTNMRFVLDDSKVRIKANGENVVGTLTLAEFNEVHRILNEGAK